MAIIKDTDFPDYIQQIPGLFKTNDLYGVPRVDKTHSVDRVDLREVPPDTVFYITTVHTDTHFYFKVEETPEERVVHIWKSIHRGYGKPYNGLTGPLEAIVAYERNAHDRVLENGIITREKELILPILLYIPGAERISVEKPTRSWIHTPELIMVQNQV